MYICLWDLAPTSTSSTDGTGTGGVSLRVGAALRGHRNWVKALAQLPDGRLCSGGNDKTVRVWRVDPLPAPDVLARDGACERVLVGHAAPVTALAALLDGRVCAASAEGVRVWDAHTGACHALLAPAPAAAGGARGGGVGAGRARATASRGVRPLT
jgi:WD40 repeat protein